MTDEELVTAVLRNELQREQANLGGRRPPESEVHAHWKAKQYVKVAERSGEKEKA